MPARETPSKGAKPDKLMRDAIMVALNREAIGADGKPTKKLYLIADKLVDLASAGDMQAIKEVNDRADGKSPQAIVGDADNPLEFVLSGLGVSVDSKFKRLIAGAAGKPPSEPE